MSLLNWKNNETGIGLRNVDFMIRVADLEGKKEYVLPDKVYWNEETYLQKVVFPVQVIGGKVSIALVYTVPVDFADSELIYSNVQLDDAENIMNDGSCYSWLLEHGTNDVVFVNYLDQSVNEMYLIPSSCRTWGTDLTDVYETGMIEPVYYAVIGFSDTEFAETRSETWEAKLVMEDGSVLNYRDIALADAMEMCLMPKEENSEECVLVTER